MLALAPELRAFELLPGRHQFKTARTVEEARERAADPVQEAYSGRLRGLMVLRRAARWFH